MKKIIALCLLLIAVVLSADTKGVSPYGGDGNRYVIHVIDTDIDAAFEIADADSGFTPLAANAPIRVLYSAANSDTAYVRIQGIRADSVWVDTTMRCPGHQAQTTAATFMAFEQAYLETEKSGVVSIYATATSAGNQLRNIAANTLHEPIAQVYADKRSVFLESVQFNHLTGVDTTSWELRIYPDVADHRDFADGYEIRAQARLNVNSPTSGVIPLGIRMPNNSWASVWAIGSAANDRGSVTLKYQRR
jgi:hypothetical protein